MAKTKTTDKKIEKQKGLTKAQAEYLRTRVREVYWLLDPLNSTAFRDGAEVKSLKKRLHRFRYPSAATLAEPKAQKKAFEAVRGALDLLDYWHTQFTDKYRARIRRQREAFNKLAEKVER